VKFRLVPAIYINGKLVPEGSFVYGIAALDGERLKIEINSIRSATNLFNVKLEVFDMDGLPGIHIPGSINRDAVKQSADNSLSLLELSSVDPSLKAQATTAGVSAVKGLFSKKIKLVRVMVKAGYKILLKDKNNEQ
jgi:conjugative transposon TraM protein